MKRGTIVAFIMLCAAVPADFLSPRPTLAAEVEMPVTVTIIVCPRDDLRNACDREARCCHLIQGEDEDNGPDEGPSPPIPPR